MKPDEAAALEKVLRDRRLPATDYVFQSERGERMSRSAFWRIVSQAGERAGLPVKAYAHLLRHSCGYYLANKGCDLRSDPGLPGTQADPEYGALHGAQSGQVRGIVVAGGSGYDDRDGSSKSTVSCGGLSDS